MAENRSPLKCSMHWKIKNLFEGSQTLVFATAAFCSVLVGVLIVKPAIIKWRVEQETLFQKGTNTYKKLVNVTVPIFFNVCVFNITNPDALETGEKFKLEELGPYVYEEKRVKHVTNEDLEQGTITYRETKTYIFRPDLSNGSESDRVNTINFPFLTVSTVSNRYIMELSNLLIGTLGAFGESVILRNVPVGNLIFKGVELDSTYDIMNELSPRGYLKQYADRTFAYFNRDNNTQDGTFTVNSGVKSSSDFGQVVSWNGEELLGFWKNGKNGSMTKDEEYCNRLNGSHGGGITPPFLTKSSTIGFFYTKLCRSILLKYNKEVSYEGIPGWQFTLPRNIFDSPRKNPDNQCFCQDPGGYLKNQCLDGMYRAFTCYADAPLVFSKPHFLDGDEQLINGVEGLKPNRAKHDSWYEVEPISGMFLRASMKFQIVAELQPLAGVLFLEDLPHVFVPTLWIEQLSYLDQENIDFIKYQLAIPLKIANWLQWILLALSGLLFSLTIYCNTKHMLIIPKVLK